MIDADRVKNDGGQDSFSRLAKALLMLGFSHPAKKYDENQS